MPSTTLFMPETGPALSPKNAGWKDCVLDLYNPLIDTNLLKEATDKSLAFLTQRKAHHYRHDFTFYDASKLDLQTRALLGY